MSRTFFLCKTKTVIRYDCLTVWKQSVFVPAGLKIRPEWFFTAFGNGFLWHWFFRFRTKKHWEAGLVINDSQTWFLMLMIPEIVMFSCCWMFWISLHLLMAYQCHVPQSVIRPLVSALHISIYLLTKKIKSLPEGTDWMCWLCLRLHPYLLRGCLSFVMVLTYEPKYLFKRKKERL